ncbi:MAG: hypothetical protein WBO93_10470 [Gammaproteobacteria bacterium]
MQKATSTLYRIVSGLILGSSLFMSDAAADGLAIDKVYHPYVQPLEREIEFRWLRFNTKDSGKNDIYRLGYGQSLSADWFAEIYIIGGNEQDELSADAYELEAKWQLTEQGEFSADWGLLFELEREADRPNWEFSTSLLVAKEWGRTVGTANLGLAFESGSDIEDELESFAALQLRYRYSRALEPALELYSGQNTLGAGPVLMGEQRFGIRKKLHWEFGTIFGISDETPDTTLRALAEFEF